MQKVLDWSVYSALRLAEALVRALPPGAAMALGDALGHGWWAVDRRRRKRAHANLEVAFPELPMHDRERLVRGAFRNMARVPIETIWIPRLLKTPAQMARRVRYIGDLDKARALGASGRPGILFSGHLGNWEVAGQVARLFPARLRVLARPIANRGVDRHVQESRGGPGSVITKHGGVRAVLRSIRKGYWVGIVGDQNAGRKGVWVPFFGLYASSHGEPAFIACREGVPFVASACIRRPKGIMRFDVYLAVLDHPNGRDVPRDETLELVRRSMEVLEGWIRIAPEQYNWLHRRWRQPPPNAPADPRRPHYETGTRRAQLARRSGR